MTKSEEQKAAREAQKIQEITDLVAIFDRPLEEYTTEELADYVTQIRHLRKVNITTKKKQKSPLDMLLKKLSPEQARKILEQLDAKEAAVKAAAAAEPSKEQ